jgi:aminoglycoside phosphotransferase (APT) family kinase protein
MYAVDVLDGNRRPLRLVLRRYDDGRRLAEDPWYRPEQEAEGLRIAEESSIPAPRLIAEDIAGRWCEVPSLLTSSISGRPLRDLAAPDQRPYLEQAAEVLARIHAVPAERTRRLPAYAPYEPPSSLSVPSWSDRRAMWERVLAVVAGPGPRDEGSFIHRDYHAGNIMVSGGSVTGVVDWPTACRGPRSIDVARMRLNLAADLDLAAAEWFLDLYGRRAGAGWSHDSYWDLVDAVDRAQDAVRPRTPGEASGWDRFEQWVEQALATLSA